MKIAYSDIVESARETLIYLTLTSITGYRNHILNQISKQSGWDMEVDAPRLT